VIGYEQSEQLDVEPAQYFVVVTRREKRACKQCEEGGVVAAPLPARIIEKSLVSDRVIVDTVPQVCRPLPVVPAERDSESRCQYRRKPRDPGWLGDARR
jgi:transposase